MLSAVVHLFAQPRNAMLHAETLESATGQRVRSVLSAAALATRSINILITKNYLTDKNILKY
jgi:hypothetical protein